MLTGTLRGNPRLRGGGGGGGIGRNKLNNMEFNIPWWKFNLTLSDLFQFLLSDLSCNLPFTSGD